MFSRSCALFSRRLCFYYRRVGFLPLPSKKDTGGEDAFLSTSAVQAVLDGVSWWRDNAGVDAGLYSASVARTMYDYVEEDLLGDVPASSYRLLEKGYEDGKHSEVQGTCTALVATLQERQPDIQDKDGYTFAELEEPEDDEAAVAAESAAGAAAAGTSGAAQPADLDPSTEADNYLLDLVFVGDCSLMVMRRDRIIYVTEEQQHDLDYPYQLGIGSKDTPSDGVRLLIPVLKGDIVIMGSDGIFDNAYPKHIASVVWERLAPVYKEYAYPGVDSSTGAHSAVQSLNRKNKLVDEMMQALEMCAEKILSIATTFSLDIRSDTPYASRCIEGGALYEGGKPDDMTVLIAVIGEEDDGSSGERFSGSQTAYPYPYRDWP